MNAENQQERLLQNEEFRWFLAGLIEGEGSLCVSFKENSSARFGFYVDVEFFIYQHENSKELLEMAREYFRAGDIVPKVGNEKVLVYRILSRRSIMEKVIPFYERYMRYASDAKRRNFQQFKAVTIAIEQKEHQTPEGMIKIVHLAYSLNHAGKQRKRPKEQLISRILRDYTPNSEIISN